MRILDMRIFKEILRKWAFESIAGLCIAGSVAACFVAIQSMASPTTPACGMTRQYKIEGFGAVSQNMTMASGIVSINSDKMSGYEKSGEEIVPLVINTRTDEIGSAQNTGSRRKIIFYNPGQ